MNVLSIMAEAQVKRILEKRTENTSKYHSLTASGSLWSQKKRQKQSATQHVSRERYALLNRLAVHCGEQKRHGSTLCYRWPNISVDYGISD